MSSVLIVSQKFQNLTHQQSLFHPCNSNGICHAVPSSRPPQNVPLGLFVHDCDRLGKWLLKQTENIDNNNPCNTNFDRNAISGKKSVVELHERLVVFKIEFCSAKATSTQSQPQLNLNLKSNPGSSQPQLNFSLNLNHNLNSIWQPNLVYPLNLSF